MASRRNQCVRACLVAVALGSAPLSARQLPAELTATAGAVDRASLYITTRQRYEAPGRPPLEIAVISKATAAERSPLIVDAVKRTVATLDDWLGPLAATQLTIVDAPWNSPLANHAYRDIVVVRSRWLNTSRDRALERELIAGIARQYWIEGFSGAGDDFAQALAVFSGGRAIDALLEGSQYYTDRYLGRFLPYSLRSLALSPAERSARPRLRRYEELRPPSGAAVRIARGLETAERYLGWPAVQQALAAFRSERARAAEDFVRVVSSQNGADLSWLFADLLNARAQFDYAIAAVDNRAQGTQFGVRARIERRGNGRFLQTLPIEITLADGTSFRDRWDARQDDAAVEYVTASPARSAAIDPDVILILDEARDNNVMRLSPSPWNRQAIQLACNWTIWLQNAMLAYAGLA